MTDGLDNFLNREPIDAQGEEQPEAVETPTPEAAEPEAESPTPARETIAEQKAGLEAEAEGQARDERGRFAAKGAEPEAVPEATDASPASEEETGNIPVSALKAERSRRQAAEEQLRNLQAQLAAQTQPQLQPPIVQATAEQQQDAPDPFVDPEGYHRWVVGQAAQVARNEAIQAFQHQRIAASADQVAAAKPDYAEKMSVFERMCYANPALLDELNRQPNPAEYAYTTAAIQIDIDRNGGIEGLINARVQQALASQAVAPAPTPAPSVPSTLADAQSSRGSTVSAPLPSLTEILRRK